MSDALIIGALLRIDLRGFSGDLPAELGAPMRDEMQQGLRALIYDLESQLGDGIVDEACARLALWFDRHFIEVDVDPFEGSAARRIKLTRMRSMKRFDLHVPVHDATCHCACHRC